MPLVASALTAYVCGLLTATTSLPMATTIAAVAVILLGARRPVERAALVVIAATGVFTGIDAREDLQACERALSARRVVQVRLQGDAGPGAFVRARSECGLTVRIAVRHGAAPSGATVNVVGTPTRGRSGLVYADAILEPGREPGLLAAIRNDLGKGIDAHFGGNAPLVRALLIADMDDLSPAIRARFAAAGLSHMLSVSGLHVGLIAAAIMLLAQLCRLSRVAAEALVVGVTAAYVMMIGAPLPAVRSAVMLAAASVSVIMQRPTSTWAVLAVGSCSPLFDPAAALDLGYQLSVAGMVALGAADALSKKWAWLAAGGMRGSLIRGLVASVAATLITTPLVAATFGTVSLVAPLSNVVAVPAMAVLQPMLFLAAVLMPIPAAAQFVADACLPLLAFVDRVAVVSAGLPGASVAVVTDPAATALAVAASVAVVIACVARHPGRALLTGAACLAALAWRPLAPRGVAETEIHMIDVGQGDAIAIRSTRGRWLLFDAGRSWEGGDAGARDVVPYIRRLGGELVGYVLSHPHSDHVGGAASVIRALRPAWYVDPGFAGPSGPYRESLVAARETGTRWRRAVPGDSLMVDEIVVTILAPEPAWADTLRDPNDASVVARVRVGAVSLLMTGDAESGEERWLVDNEPWRLDADILKVGHHGSNTSSTPEFVAAVSPRLALVSVGAGNMYRHPSAAVIRTLAAAGATTMRTDRSGTVVVRTDGRRIEVDVAGERWVVP